MSRGRRASSRPRTCRDVSWAGTAARAARACWAVSSAEQRLAKSCQLSEQKHQTGQQASNERQRTNTNRKQANASAGQHRAARQTS